MDGNSTEQIEQHLLYYKALAENKEDIDRIDGYLRTLRETNDNAKLDDPVDESIRAVFSAVLDNGFDPWAIDIDAFVKVYTEKVASNRFDMVVAGSLVLMAWKVLNAQSDKLRMVAEPPEPEVVDDDFAFEDEDPMVVPDVMLNVTYARDVPRSVTMKDILDAFEGARAEAEAIRIRELNRQKLKAKEPLKFDNKAHREDDEKTVERVYELIKSMGPGPMPITEFYTNDIERNITVFVSVLHLVRRGLLDVSQTELPYGEITVQIKAPEAQVPVAEAAVN
ncbi:MAG: chromosome segregation protein ScpA [Methanomethylophilus sp.]|jgi:segregation and condensation protein A